MPSKFKPQQVNKRRAEIIAAGIRLASKPGGFTSLTQATVAVEAGCSYGLVSNYLGSIHDIRATLVRAAMKQSNFPVLAQAMLAGHPEARKMPAAMRAQVVAHISGE